VGWGDRCVLVFFPAAADSGVMVFDCRVPELSLAVIVMAWSSLP
jgi:hypothetical protein